MKKTLLALALAAGLTSFAGSAKADIVYSDTPFDTTNWSGHFLSIGDFTDILQVGANGGIKARFPWEQDETGTAFINGEVNTDAKFVLSNLNDVISMTTTGLRNFLSLDNGDQYLGFSFNNNATTDYGWLAVSVSGVGGVEDTSVNISSYAYDNTGSSIKVGQTAVQAVPEPSTYALFALGALALVVAYRRKVA
jgi:hypothetical protein